MSTRSRSIGNRRLLRLAEFLDTLDEKRKRHDLPGYNQDQFIHPCGTPSCALGVWAAANPTRWQIQPETFGRTWITYIGSSVSALPDSTAKEFDITRKDFTKLFEVGGCGGAQTGKQAAQFIRRFVARRTNAKKRALRKRTPA